jgi:F-type H+-transporting ATPase subunit delta
MAEWSTLARPYAKAAFDYARSADALAAWSQQLALAAALVGNDKLLQVIESPSVTVARQAQILVELCGDELSDKVRNFLRVVAENKRLKLLPEISAQFEQFKAAQEQSVHVEVASAFALGGELEQQLAQALRGKLQRDVTIATVVDKSLLGGVVVRAGDVVIDGSVRGRLAKLAKAMTS